MIPASRPRSEQHSAPRMWPGLVLLAFALAGCEDHSEPGWIVRPFWEADDSLPPRADQLVWSENVAATDGAWSARAVEVAREPSSGSGPPLLRLDAPQRLEPMLLIRRVGVDTAADASGPAPLLLRVLASASGTGHVAARWLINGTEHARAAPVAVIASGDLEWTELAVDGEPQPDAVLEVSFEAALRRVHVARVELVRRPAAAWVPDPRQGEAVFVLGQQSRMATGLVSGSTLRASLLVPARARLHASWGRPPVLTRDGGSSTLKLSIRGETSGVVERVPIGAEGGRWFPFSVDLGSFAGERVELMATLIGAPTAVALADVNVAASGSTPPAVLIVTTDTHRADHIGAAGSGVDVYTPALDALAAQGVLFTRCFASTNVTNPSHVSLFTGEHPRDLRILHNHVPLGAAAPTLAEAFREAGWSTIAVVSASHLGHVGSGLGQGFDRMVWPEDGEWRANEAVRHMERWWDQLGGRPVFAWLHVFDAHWPYKPPAEDTARYWTDGRDPRDPALPPLTVDSSILPEDMRDLRDLDWPRALYKGEVTFLDRQLGGLFARPSLAAGVTAVVGDHGESLGAHGVYFTHAELYPDTLHVPLIVRVGAGFAPPPPWPSAGARFEAPVRHVDLGRTVLDLTGLSAPSFPGQFLATERTAPRFAISSHGLSESINDGRFHLVRHIKKHHQRFLAEGYSQGQLELFDLEADPAATHDLSSSRPELIQRLRAQLDQWRDNEVDLGWADPSARDPSLAETLRRLGYVEPDGG